MTKRNKILLTIVITAFVALSTCVVASAQAYDGTFDYLDSPTVIITAYPNYTEQYNFDKPLFQYIASGWQYLPPNYIDVSARGFNVTFYREFYDNYSFDDIETTFFNYTVIVFERSSLYGGTFSSFMELCDLNTAVSVSRFPTVELMYEQLENAYYEQFIYWENRLEVEFDNGFAFGQEQGLHTGYANGYNTGYNDAISDSDAYLEGLFAVFDAPFVFLENLGTFEVFGITIIDVITFLLIICFALFIYKVIRRFLPI